MVSGNHAWLHFENPVLATFLTKPQCGEESCCCFVLLFVLALHCFNFRSVIFPEKTPCSSCVTSVPSVSVRHCHSGPVLTELRWILNETFIASAPHQAALWSQWKWSALSEIIGITHSVKHFHSKLLSILMKTWSYKMKCFASGKHSRYWQKNDFSVAAPIDFPNFMGPSGLSYGSQTSHVVCDTQKNDPPFYSFFFHMYVRI